MADTSNAIEADYGSSGLGERMLTAVKGRLINIVLAAERSA